MADLISTFRHTFQNAFQQTKLIPNIFHSFRIHGAGSQHSRSADQINVLFYDRAIQVILDQLIPQPFFDDFAMLRFPIDGIFGRWVQTEFVIEISIHSGTNDQATIRRLQFARLSNQIDIGGVQNLSGDQNQSVECIEESISTFSIRCLKIDGLISTYLSIKLPVVSWISQKRTCL